MIMVQVRCLTCGAVDEALDRGRGVETRCKCGGIREATGNDGIQHSHIQPDDIVGGVTYKHGICWPDGTPRTFYSRRKIRQAEEAAGLVPLECEIPVTSDEIARNLERTGQSKRPLTCSGVLTPEDEAARVANWHAHEATLQTETQK